jgi:hypothetical protein
VGEHLALVDFMRLLYEGRHLNGGKYMIVAIDDSVYDPAGPKDQYMIVDYLDPYATGYGNFTRELMAPFAHVLKVTPTHSINANYR